MICKECEAKYKGAVAGQGFTKYVCKKCGQIAWYHNTLTPNYCTYCCEQENICEYCGKNLYVEAILEEKEKSNLYAVALDMDVSETSLYKFIKTGSVGSKVLKKIKIWYEGRNGR